MAVIEIEEDGIATDQLNSVNFDVIAYAGRVEGSFSRVFRYTRSTFAISTKMS